MKGMTEIFQDGFQRVESRWDFYETWIVNRNLRAYSSGNVFT